MRGKTWFYVAMGGIVTSAISLLLPVVRYLSDEGMQYSYSIIDLLLSNNFRETVLRQYRGEVLWSMEGSTVNVLAAIAIIAFLSAVVGLITLRAQRPNTWQFILTVAGLIGTAFPSILIIIAVLLSKNHFIGTIQCGIAPIITPIAMLICIGAVKRRRDRVLEELRAQLEAQGLIRPAGDYNGPPVKTTISNFIVNQIFPILTLAASRATPHI